MTYCDRCKKEVVIGVSETSGEKIPFNPWPERRYIFIYGNQPIVRWINTWTPHQCVLPEEGA